MSRKGCAPNIICARYAPQVADVKTARPEPLADWDFEHLYEPGEFDPIVGFVKPARPAGLLKAGEQAEWTHYIAERRIQKYAWRKAFGKAPIKTRQNAEEEMLERLVPKALKVLKEQLDSPDDRVRQAAAVKVLEYTKGKPVQAIKAETVGIQKIVYESAAWQPQMEALEGQAVEVMLLPELTGDDGEDPDETDS